MPIGGRRSADSCVPQENRERPPLAEMRFRNTGHGRHLGSTEDNQGLYVAAACVLPNGVRWRDEWMDAAALGVAGPNSPRRLAAWYYLVTFVPSSRGGGSC
jgi:hypothetical protein